LNAAPLRYWSTGQFAQLLVWANVAGILGVSDPFSEAKPTKTANPQETGDL
jgi:hypothetical protein